MFKAKQITDILVVSILIGSFFAFNNVSAGTAPDLRDLSANVTGPHNAVLSIFVDPNESPTDLHFKYWTGSIFMERLYLGARGDSFIKIDMGLINLAEGATYSYQVVAQNSGGSASSVVGTFSTSGGSSLSGGSSAGSYTGGSATSSGSTSSNSSNLSGPSVVTNGPASVSATSVSVNGSINPNNSNTSFWFEFGSSQSLGQKTSIQSLGSGSSWQLVTGNISGLTSGATYYYRVVAQNNFGTNFGDIKSFTTSTGQNGATSQGSNNGQVLGSIATSNGTSGNGSVSAGSSTATRQTANKVVVSKTNSRPSFISLEYSLADDGALVHVADNIKPGPGDDFTYTVVYKNDTAYLFSNSKLKVIIPSEAHYVSSNLEPLQISGNIVEFDLRNIQSGSQGEVVVVSKIREGVAADTNLIFTSVLTYKDRLGVQLATTSYLTVKTGRDGTSLSASFLGAMFSSSSILILVAVGFVILMSILTYYLVKAKRRNGTNGKKEDDEFGLGSIPATFEPIGPIRK